MSGTFELRLPFDEPDEEEVRDLPDAHARAAAVDPAQNIVLEASAGTGKTRVLVERYVNLLRAGVEPDHILAITFTRKAAAEMRQRIVERLKEASRLSEFDAARWRELKERLGDIAISTIDAFCLSLLREFPLEADVDPGFDLAADSDLPRLSAESLDATFRICREIARDDDDVALVFAQLGERRLRRGIAALLDRRLVAPQALGRFLARGPKDLTAEAACVNAANRLRGVFASARDGIEGFLCDGPVHRPQFAMLADDIRALVDRDPEGVALQDRDPKRVALHDHDPKRVALHDHDLRGTPVARPFQGRDQQAAFRNFIDRVRAYFLTQKGDPRGGNFTGTGFSADHCHTEDAWKRHRQTAASLAPQIADAIRGFRRDLNVVMSRGVWRIFAVALHQYDRTLESHALLDFSGVLDRAVRLLKELDEFAESRLRLEARHRHVLVDELQDTSRAQWDLVVQLVRSWGEGLGAADDAIPPSIFVVGDRKQSIYGFRDADVSVVDDAAAFIETLRRDGRPRRAITVSFRSAPEILAFVNDVFGAIVGSGEASQRRDAFRYDAWDRFPIDETARVRLKTDATTVNVRLKADTTSDGALGIIVAEGVQATADSVAAEIVSLLANGALVRDRQTGLRREAKPADIAVLFRSRDSHRDYEAALQGRGVPTYVYKGLGFFESDEVQDAVALLRYLADPLSDVRAAAFLRSRIVRLSDHAIGVLGPELGAAIQARQPAERLDAEDRRVLEQLRSAVPAWLRRVDRQMPSELLDSILRETAYAFELRGPRRLQARENLKKLRAMVRRAQNRGYTTLARLADHLDELAVGDESNAAIDAIDAVSLMTVHAAKGLEFPIVFIVNMGRGTGGIRPSIRVSMERAGEPSVSIADYQSEADEDAAVREREEGKRLLYVALTRARDRLYLSGSLKEGKFRPGPGSLGQTLPDEVRQLFVAAAGAECVEWNGPSGARHSLASPRPSGERRSYSWRAAPAAAVDDFAP